MLRMGMLMGPHGGVCGLQMRRKQGMDALCRRPRVTVNASDRDRTGSGGGLDPALEIAIPVDQRPVNELAALRESDIFNWATLPTSDYVSRLGTLWAAVLAVPSLPIAAATFDPLKQPVEFGLAGSAAALVVVVVAVLRIYAGWSYVGDRLLSASIDYEETGWYDGQIWTKPPEVLARDRLLGLYEVKPTLNRLKATLVICAVTICICGGSLSLLADASGLSGRANYVTPRVVPGGVVYSSSGSELSSLAADEAAAAAEAEAQNGRPGFCGDQFYRAMAGGAGSACAAFE